MKVRFFLAGMLSIGLSWMVSAQDATTLKYGNTITEDDLRRHLTIMAGEEFEGRNTGEKGQKLAAAYIRDFFSDLGIAGPVNGSYYQEFDLARVNYPKVDLKIGRTNMAYNKDFIFIGDVEKTSSEKADIVFLGEATEANLRQVDVKGKIAAVYAIGARAQNVVRSVMDAGAKGVLIVTMEGQESFDRLASRYASMSQRGRMGFEKKGVNEPIFLTSTGQMASLFGLDEAGLKAAATNPEGIKPLKASFKVTKNVEYFPTENVLGFIEGSEKPEEVLIISAHYDHTGFNTDGSINYGADDNGSGTVAVMEMAEAFALAAKDGIKPRRSVLFALWTAEEIGLLGSQYYAENPIFPLENTVNNLNIDMIGRIDTNYEKEEDQNYLYVIGSEVLSTHLKMIIDYNNITYTGLNLDYRYDAPDDPNRFYFRSDHYNLAKYNIPSVFFFNGVHPDYHTPADTVDKIEFPLMTTRAQMIFYTAWDLANRAERNPVNRVNTRGER
ncbi:MAG: M28 family metallopeptidase [Nitritalea sp.]